MNSPSTLLDLPPAEFALDLAAIENHSGLLPSTKNKYTQVIAGYLNTGHNLFDARALSTYAAGLPAASRSHLRSATKLLMEDLAHSIKSQATPENVHAVNAALYRLEALTTAIVTERTKGEKSHTWLTGEEVRALMNTCPTGQVNGRRDWIVLACLVGTGLRREELAGLTFAALMVQPTARKRRVVLNVTGKGAKSRIIPLSEKLADQLASWKAEIGEGRIVRGLDRAGVLRAKLSPVSIFEIVRKHGAEIGFPALAPHDLRRTYAQLGLEAGVPITQISQLLGHASVATTQRYLNLSVNLEKTISDFIPL